MNQSTGWALVGAQFGVLTALVVFPSGDLWERTGVTLGLALGIGSAGVLVALAAGLRLGRSLTPLPNPKDDGVLVTQGLYRYVRHPIYTGVLLMALGFVAWGASLWHIVGWVWLWLILSLKVSVEEKMLKARYGEYEAYSTHTGRLVPRMVRKEP
jgi:protein-S-isoprenylcysteine O-methyltransferase Ste14